MNNDTEKADKILKVGQRLSFYMDNDESYSSRIEDIQPTEMIVAMPMDSKRVPIIPPDGAHLYGAVLMERCQFRFFSVFKKKGMLNNVPCWWIKKPELLQRYQNRKFVRVKVSLPISVQIMNDEGGFDPPKMTNLIDLSGSGLAFVSDKKVPRERQVIMELHNLPEIGTLQVMGVVQRCTEIELQPKRKIYQIGVRMLDLTRPIRNRLVHFIFELQRKELAKGLNLTGVQET